MNSLLSDLTTYNALLVIALLFIYTIVRNSILVSLVLFLYKFPLLQKIKANSTHSLNRDIVNEIPAAVRTLVLDTLLFFLFLSNGYLPNRSSHLNHDLLTFSALFVWFEFWFYSTHRLLHTKHLFRIHKTHHRTRTPTPISAFSFSLTERMILFSGTTVLIFILGPMEWFTTVGIALYFNFNVLFSVIGHSDCHIVPQRFRKYLVFNLITDPPEHSLHHKKVTTNYGLFLNVFDRLFNTYTMVHYKSKEGPSHE